MPTLTSRKKILFTSHTANFSKFNRQFMRWFKEQGYEVHYASAGEEEVKDCDKHFTIPFERSPIKINNIKAYFKLRSIINREQYTLIHTHTPMGGVVTRLAARRSRKHGTIVFYTAHGFHFYRGSPILNWIAYFPIEWLLSHITDHLVTINNEDFQLARQFLSAKDIHYLEGGVGVDLSKFRPLTQEEIKKKRKQLSISSESLVLIYTAEFIYRKNHEFIIRNLPALKKIHPDLKLILPGKGELLNFIKNLVNKLGLADDVFFIGYRNDISSIIGISDIAISTSRQEGQGLGLVEALACGIPVVASNERGHRSIAELYSEGVSLFHLNDTDFIEKIKNQVSKGKSNHNLGIISDTFGIDSSTLKMGSIYKLAIDSKVNTDRTL